jgi:hypothetical protein
MTLLKETVMAILSEINKSRVFPDRLDFYIKELSLNYRLFVHVADDEN